MSRLALVLTLVMLAGFAWSQPQVDIGTVDDYRDSLPTLEKLNDPLAAGPAPAETTLKDQTDLAVTVYNNNRALVRDRRLIALPDGEISLKFMDVAQQIQPETVSLKSLNKPDGLAVLEQNYEYDLMTPEKLMEKYVGREVALVNKHADYGFSSVKATLLSVNNGPIYQVGEEIHLGHPGNVVLPEIPDELIAKPSLIWLLNAIKAKHEIEATYLTSGLAWRADYIVSLDRDEKLMGLEGWVTLNNESGATYRDAQLKLVAGEVNIVQERVMAKSMRGGGGRGRALAAAPPMREESFAEYHLYTLPRRTTIKQNQSKQVRLLTAAGVSVKKIYEYRGQAHFYSNPVAQFEPEHVDAVLAFRNDKENELGMPLPGGIMRIYQEDQDGMRQFSGEDRIKHTPKDEDVRLRMGKAFDVVAERVQKDYKRISSTTHESEFEIILRNHKEKDIVVDVVEPLMGEWKMLENSHKYKKKDARTAVFSIPVEKDGEAKLTYRVRITY
jgi:hypothetical protein